MRRKVFTVLLSAALIFVVTIGVGAKGSFSFSGSAGISSVFITGVSTGVANDAVLATMTADVTVNGVCINNGSNKAEGVNDVRESLGITETYTADDRGRIVFGETENVLKIEDPVNDDGKDPTLANEAKICKNHNWTFVPDADEFDEDGNVISLGVAWGIVTVEFQHSSGTTVKTWDCTGVAAGGTCPEQT